MPIWMHNKIWWYPGLRRLMPTPWVYKVPNFEWVDKEQYKKYLEKQKAAPAAAVKPIIIINREPVAKIKAAPINQQSLF